MPEGAGEDGTGGKGISTFAVLIGMSFLILVGFFGTSTFAVWQRRSRGTTRQAAPTAIALPQAPAPDTASPTLGAAQPTAIVVPKGYKTGILRSDATTKSDIVAYVPANAVVMLGASKTEIDDKKRPQVWYRVRAVVDNKTYEGWMHSDILKLQ
jgi:hypothetical protein